MKTSNLQRPRGRVSLDVLVPRSTDHSEVAAHVMAVFLAPPVRSGRMDWRQALDPLRMAIRQGMAGVEITDPSAHAAFSEAEANLSQALVLAQIAMPELLHEVATLNGEAPSRYGPWARSPPARLSMTKHVLDLEQEVREQADKRQLPNPPPRTPSVTESNADVANYLARQRKRTACLLHIAAAASQVIHRLEKVMIEDIYRVASAQELEALGCPLDTWEGDAGRQHRLRLTTGDLLRCGPTWTEIVNYSEAFEEPARRYLAGGRAHPIELQRLRWLDKA